MTTPYVLTPRAEQDLDEIWEYIAADSLDAADRVLAKIGEKFEQLARSPVSDITATTWRTTGTAFSSFTPT